MFVWIFTNLSILFMPCIGDMLSDFWVDEHSQLNYALRGLPMPEKENKILVSRLSKDDNYLVSASPEASASLYRIWYTEFGRVSLAQIQKLFALLQLPFTEVIKSDVWYEILRHQRIESLDVSDWQAYEPLIPYLPLSMLRKVNFSDDLILSYFGKQKLSQYQLPQLAEEVLIRGHNVLDREEEIIKLGNIICGFTEKDMSLIKEAVWRSLLEKDFFQSIKACSPEQLNYLSKLLKQYTVLGPPRTWPPETVKQAGSLVAGLKPFEMREIREKSFSQISPEVIDLAPVESLRVIKDSQLKTLNRTALLSWRRKTRDLRGLYMSKAAGFSVKINFATVLPVYLSVNWGKKF